jgi:hypothetical protein
MDNNAELRSALIYFADEAIGWRKSLHHFQRWLETGEQSELEALIIEVGREHFIDFYPLLNAIKDGNDSEGLLVMHNALQRGLHVPEAWLSHRAEKNITLLPLDFEITGNLFNNAATLWKLRDWVDDNNKRYEVNGLSILALAHQLLLDARTNFFKVFELLEILLGANTIFSCVLDNSIKRLGRNIASYYPLQSNHIITLASAVQNNPTLNWKDALSRNQVRSKIWLIEQLDTANVFPSRRRITDPEHVTVIVGGWVGLLPFLASMLGKNLDTVVNVDVDTSVHAAANELNLGRQPKFKNSKEDIRTMDFSAYKKLLVIDTIVEHFEEHGSWVKTLPATANVVLQGNDMFHVPDHVNCHTSLEEFTDTCGLSTINWFGELSLYKCNRFMAIGKV